MVLYVSLHMYNIKSFESVRSIIVIRKCQVTIATNCWEITHCMSYVVGHEIAISLLFQCIRMREIIKANKIMIGEN
jgi:hypothetical protein